MSQGAEEENNRYLNSGQSLNVFTLKLFRGRRRTKYRLTFIRELEKGLGNALVREVEFNKVHESMKPGNMPATYASTDKLYGEIGFKPETSIKDD